MYYTREEVREEVREVYVSVLNRYKENEISSASIAKEIDSIKTLGSLGSYGLKLSCLYMTADYNRAKASVEEMDDTSFRKDVACHMINVALKTLNRCLESETYACFDDARHMIRELEEIKLSIK